MDGLLGGIDWAKLGIDPEYLKLLQAGQQTDAKGPLSQGLLAAGLGMLANANRGTAEGIGAGGLLGLGAYNAEKQRQMKDPLQQLQIAQGLMGLEGAARKNAWLRDVGGTGTPEQPQPMGPPADMAQNFMGPPALPTNAPLAPATGAFAAPVAKLVQGMLAGVPGADKLYEAAIRAPTMQSQGQAAVSVNPFTGEQKAGPQLPRVAENMVLDPLTGAVSNRPGAVQSAAAAAGATTSAQEQAKAGLDLVTVDMPDGTKRQMPRAQAIALTSGQQPAAQSGDVPPAIKAAYADYVKGGDFSKPFTLTYRQPEPSGPVGTTRTPEAAALAQQQALAAGQLSAKAAENINATDAKFYETQREKMLAAMQTNQTVERIIPLVTGPNAALSGMMQPGVQGALNFFNSINIPVNSEKFKNSQTAEAWIKGLSAAQVKVLFGGQNLSDQDRKAAYETMPSMINNPEVRLRLLNTIKESNDNQIAYFNKIDSHIAKNNTLRGFDYKYPDGTNAEKAKPSDNEKPPMAGAQKAPDGNWYLKSGSKFYRVDQ